MTRLLIICFLLVSFSACNKGTKPTNTVNAVIGDVSFLNKYGRLPGNTVSEHDRIKTHLEYVEQLIASQDMSHLPANLQQKRKHMLYLLHEYRLAGRYPSNYDHPATRKPCFIDRNGNICAIGYLIAQTAGRPLAEKINQQHQYDLIRNMKNAELLAWVDNSGLTLEECEMIQPQYGNYNENYISPAYGISTAMWSGTNISLTAMSSIEALKGSDRKLFPVLGIASGAGQMILGFAALVDQPDGFGRINYGVRNEARKAVSYINIGIGTTTVLLNTFNLVSGRRKRKNKSSVSLYSGPSFDSEPVAGLTFTRKL